MAAKPVPEPGGHVHTTPLDPAAGHLLQQHDVRVLCLDRARDGPQVDRPLRSDAVSHVPRQNDAAASHWTGRRGSCGGPVGRPAGDGDAAPEQRDRGTSGQGPGSSAALPPGHPPSSSDAARRPPTQPR